MKRWTGWTSRYPYWSW